MLYVILFENVNVVQAVLKKVIKLWSGIARLLVNLEKSFFSSRKGVTPW